MTATDQDEAAEMAARELARRLAPVTTLKDPHAAATHFIGWMRAHGWYCRVKGAERPPGSGTDPTPAFLAAKAALTRKDTEDHA